MEVFPPPLLILTGGICLWTERYFNSVSLYLSVFVFLFAIGPHPSILPCSILPRNTLTSKFFQPFSTFDNRNNDLFQVYYDSDNIRRDVVAFNPDVKPEVDYLSNSDIL